MEKRIFLRNFENFASILETLLQQILKKCCKNLKKLSRKIRKKIVNNFKKLREKVNEILQNIRG